MLGQFDKQREVLRIVFNSDIKVVLSRSGMSQQVLGDTDIGMCCSVVGLEL